MLEEDKVRGLSLVDVGVDYTKVEPVQHKRTLAFINHFAIHTVHFLNRFSSSCEEKLSAVEERIRRMEVTVNILDTKLSSIAGLESVTGEQYQPPACLVAAGSATGAQAGTSSAPSAPSTPATSANSKTTTDGSSSVASASKASDTAARAPASSSTAPQAAPSRDSDSDSDFDDDSSTATGATGAAVSATPISKDPRYMKYFNLIKIGVPVAAFRAKMVAEGLNPDLMEDPDAPAPPAGGAGGGGAPKAVDSDDDDEDDDDDDDDD
eukprot:scpid98954/ scgid29645/ WASH complex subunit CCDC53; Coiled-coil domain-containing protein 53